MKNTLLLAIAFLLPLSFLACSDSSDDAGTGDGGGDGDSDSDSDTEPVCGWEVVVDNSEYLGGFEDAWGSGPDDVFAVGSPGILHFDGTEWTLQVGQDEGFYFEGVWGTSATNVYAAGGHSLLHYDGVEWAEVPLPETYWCKSVWGNSPDDVFVIGEKTTFLHFDGTDWEVKEFLGGDDYTWTDLWGTQSGDVFALGYEKMGVYTFPPRIAHHDGTEWSMMLTDEEWPVYVDIWGTAANDVYAVTGGPCVIHYAELRWEPFQECGAVEGSESEMELFQAIWGTSSSNIYVAEREKDIWRYDGQSWSVAYTKPDSGYIDAKSIWGSSPEDIYVVGDEILHYGCE